MNTQRLVEIRTYKLKPGSGAAFHALVSGQSVPLLRVAQMDVVAYGQALHDVDDYYLIRSYANLQDLTSSQEEFYASAAWRQGPREAVITLIVSDANATMWLSTEAVEAIRVGCNGGSGLREQGISAAFSNPVRPG